MEKVQEIRTTDQKLKVFPSNKGFQHVATYKGYFYTHDRDCSDKSIFRCAQRISGCKGRIYLSVSRKSVTSADQGNEDRHNHGPDQSKCNAKYMMSKVKMTAASTRESTSSVLATHLQDIPSSTMGSLPTMSSMKRTVQYVRSSKRKPIIAATRSEIPDLAGMFLTVDQDDFLFRDVTISTPNDRILIWTTNKKLDWLQASPHWFCDGTFKSSPCLFDQLIVLHGLRIDGNNVTCFPLVYILAPNRLQRTYVRVLKELKSARPALAPVSVMTDFEKALRNAFTSEFPQVTLRGCFFHFSQANVKHIRGDCELRELRSTDSDWGLELKKVVALAFVPTSKVVAAFELLESSRPFVENADVLERYLDYFMNTWIGGFDRRGQRKAPEYAIDGWNCHESVLQDLPKTNNYCEGFHRSFSSLLTAQHPTLDLFVEGLLKQERLTDCAMEQFIAGNRPPPVLQQVKAAKKLKIAVGRYGSLSTLEFLRGVAYNYNM